MSVLCVVLVSVKVLHDVGGSGVESAALSLRTRASWYAPSKWSWWADFGWSPEREASAAAVVVLAAAREQRARALGLARQSRVLV